MKEQIANKINLILEEKVNSLNHAIQSSIESRDNETKSSVGDKYETGRAMAQMELEKNRIQLNKVLNMQRELERINLYKKLDKVEFGSIVETNSEMFFISVSLGKISFDNKTIFCISLASPIGKILYNKKVGNNFLFQEKEISILNIS